MQNPVRKIPLILACLAIQGWAGAQQQIENGSFEIWEDAGTVAEEPVDWSSIKTSDNDITNSAAPLVWDRSTDAHSGNYSVKLYNVASFGVVATGTLTNGRVHAEFNPDSAYVYTQTDDARWHAAFTDRPDSLVGWYKYFPSGNDRGGIRAILHSDKGGALPEHGTHGDWVADANFIMPEGTADSWTRFSVPFDYLSGDTPGYLLVVIKAGFGTDAIAGSYGLFDDLQLIYGNSGGTGDIAEEKINFELIGNKVLFREAAPDVLKNTTFRILDLRGRILFEVHSPETELTLPLRLPAGIYVGCILYDNGIRSKKIFLD